jgi:LPXTG-site transpeptidase (sortase) family protein
MAQAFIGGGLLLLVVGGFLIYPYASSRLAAPPPAPTDAPRTLVPTATRIPPTAASTVTPTLSSPITPTHHPTSTPTPTPLPVIPETIVIPVIHLEAPVVPVSWTITEVDGQERPMWDLPDTRAAGWHETSASLGVPGNTVLSGHNTTNGEVFRDLYKLEAGDEIVLAGSGITYTYAVTQTLILPEAGQPLEVRIQNARYIEPTADERLTIVTCHPYGSLRNRLIVIAQPVEHSTLIAPDPER